MIDHKLVDKRNENVYIVLLLSAFSLINVCRQMADENVNTEISVEENGTSEPVNDNEEPSDVSSALQKEDDEGKGDGLLFDRFISFFPCVLFVVRDFILVFISFACEQPLFYLGNII